jgi:hypothetical protein
MNVGIQDEARLDKDGRLIVRWVELTDGLCVEIEDSFHQTWLKPEHALALLSWLKRHHTDLDVLATRNQKKRRGES